MTHWARKFSKKNMTNVDKKQGRVHIRHNIWMFLSCLYIFFFFAVYFTYAQSRTAQPLNIHSYVVVVLTNKTEDSHMLTAVNWIACT